MEPTGVAQGQIAASEAIEQQHNSLKSKQGPCPGLSQRRATSGGGHSSRRSKPGHPVGLDAAVTPSCTPAVTFGAGEAAGAPATQTAADQARANLASLAMERPVEPQAPRQQVHPLPAAPPSTPATATAAAAAAAAACDDESMLAVAAEEPSLSDLEDLFAEAEGVVDTFMRHPSNPQAAKLFGADVSDALARLASSSTPAGVATGGPQRSKPSFLSSLGLRYLGFGAGAGNPSPQQQASTPAKAAAAAATAAPTAASGVGGWGPHAAAAACQGHLSGTKRSKPSFTLSRDPAADRPSSRRELDCGSNGPGSSATAPSAGPTAAQAAGGGGAAAAMAAVPAHASAGLAAAPTPPPSATCSAAEAAAAGLAGFSRRKWGLDLSDSGMAAAAAASPRASPFAAAGHQSAAGWGSDPTAGRQPGSSPSSHGSRQHRASNQGVPVAAAGLKARGSSAAARRSSCPGIYLAGGPRLMLPGAEGGAAFQDGSNNTHAAVAAAGLGLDVAAAEAGGAASLAGATSSGGLRVLDLSSPRSRQGLGGSAAATAAAAAAADVSMSPFASPGTASSSALAAAAAAASHLLASGAFNGAAPAALQGSRLAPSGTAAASGPSTTATSEPHSTDKACSSSLQSKRSVGGASATVNRAPRPGVTSAAAAAGTNSPPAVFVTITSSSGQGPMQQALTRKVSSRSVGSPHSGDAMAAAAAAAAVASVDMAVDSEQLSAACAAAMAAVAAEAAAGSSAAHQQQQQHQQEVDGDLPRLRPIRTKSRAEGPAAILNPSATGTAALEAAAAFAPAARAGSGATSSSLGDVIAQQQMLLLQHQQQQQQQQLRLQSGALQTVSASQSAGLLAQQHLQQPITPAVTPATAHAAGATGMQAAATGDLLAAAAASIAGTGQAGPAADPARVSCSGTPSGIVSSIAQMTLQSPAQLGMHLAQTATPAAAPSVQQPALQAQQQQQQPAELPWQHLPASACNGVAVLNGDSGLVLIAGRTVTTGLIKPAAQPKAQTNQHSSSGSSYNQGTSNWMPGPAAGPLPGPLSGPVPGCMVWPYSTGAQTAAAWGVGGATGVQAAAGYSLAAGSMPGHAGAGGADMAAAAAAQQAAARRMSAPQIPYTGDGLSMSAFGPGFGTAAGFPAAAQAGAGAAGMSGAGQFLQAFPADPQAAGGMAQPPVPMTAVVAGSSPAEAIAGGIFSGFGDPEDMQEELSTQQLQDLMAGSALMHFPGSDVFGSFIYQQQ